MTQPQVDLLRSVLDETEATIAVVTSRHEHLPTPCPEFDVARLVDHLIGWANSFATRLAGGSVTGNPNDYRAGVNPAVEFHQAARAIVGAYLEGGEQTEKLPAGFVIMEVLVHGWDLAAATGRSVRFSPAAAQLALATGRQMLQPQYRGPGKPFGDETQVSEAAGPVDRLVAFMGRDPGWKAPPGQ